MERCSAFLIGLILERYSFFDRVDFGTLLYPSWVVFRTLLFFIGLIRDAVPFFMGLVLGPRSIFDGVDFGTPFHFPWGCFWNRAPLFDGVDFGTLFRFFCLKIFERHFVFHWG